MKWEIRLKLCRIQVKWGESFHFIFHTIVRHAGNEKGEWKRWLEHWRENTKENCNSVMFFLWSIKYTSTWVVGVLGLILVNVWGWLWHQTEMWIRNNDGATLKSKWSLFQLISDKRMDYRCWGNDLKICNLPNDSQPEIKSNYIVTTLCAV